MPTLYLPRRHRRSLLFPPGLLALAWLLWLGCVALPRMRGMEKPQAVLQLTMPYAPLSEGKPLPIIWEGAWMTQYSSPVDVEKFRTWQTLVFSGNLWADYFSYKQASLVAVRVKKDTTYKSGLRIKFNSGSVYKSFIFAIDLLNREKISSWWVDTRHQPTTLYAFISKPKIIEGFLCGTDAHITRIPKPIIPLTATVLIHPDWRNTTLLLLLMALLSTVGLCRQHRAG